MSTIHATFPEIAHQEMSRRLRAADEQRHERAARRSPGRTSSRGRRTRPSAAAAQVAA